MGWKESAELLCKQNPLLGSRKSISEIQLNTSDHPFPHSKTWHSFWAALLAWLSCDSVLPCSRPALNQDMNPALKEKVIIKKGHSCFKKRSKAQNNNKKNQYVGSAFQNQLETRCLPEKQKSTPLPYEIRDPINNVWQLPLSNQLAALGETLKAPNQWYVEHALKESMPQSPPFYKDMEPFLLLLFLLLL